MNPWRARGDAHPRAKLTAQQIAVLKEKRRQGLTITKLAEEAKVSQGHLSKVLRGLRRSEKV